MTDDIVTRLRTKYSGQLPICSEAADEIERLRAEVARLGSFLYPVGAVIPDNPRRVAETLGSGEHIYAPFDGKVKDIHASCRNEVERLRKLSNELLEALIEMADKEMLPKITIRLRDTAQALEQAVRGE